MVDQDLAQLFRNAFPNTLDTTIRWHLNGSTTEDPLSSRKHKRDNSKWQGPQTFVVTGDINAEWLRDSTSQLSGYQALARQDPALHTLILGAINTQAEFVTQSPYCNAFQPPPPSGQSPVPSSQKDTVHPEYDPSVVFECKYELDSLASFLALGTEFYENTNSTAFLTSRWYQALDTLLSVLDAQSQSTFNAQNQYVPNQYRFQRETNMGTETLNLEGVGNPLNGSTGLIRSAFRPSDDATIFGFFIPPNAMMAVQLQKTARVVKVAGGHEDLATELQKRGDSLEQAVWDYGVVDHGRYGNVFAFEVDGYGSRVMMDDANVPSLLSLPLLGFVEQSNVVYQNTRRMILEKTGNPYYLIGSAFRGIGGPHGIFPFPVFVSSVLFSKTNNYTAGLENAWPMSLLVQAMTTDIDSEITECINLVRNSSLLGLVHESIDVTDINKYTRSWFAWANSLFAQAVLKFAAERPYLIFGDGARPYVV